MNEEREREKKTVSALYVLSAFRRKIFITGELRLGLEVTVRVRG
jgi:hypothetical protein